MGETSGSLQRALGLGKSVIVSDIGSFAELPDDVCLKVAVGRRGRRSDLRVPEYAGVAAGSGAGHGAERAKEWVARECNWGVVAERYVEFLEESRAEAKRLPQREEKPGELPVPVAAEALPRKRRRSRGAGAASRQSASRPANSPRKTSKSGSSPEGREYAAIIVRGSSIRWILRRRATRRNRYWKWARICRSRPR